MKTYQVYYYPNQNNNQRNYLLVKDDWVINGAYRLIRKDDKLFIPYTDDVEVFLEGEIKTELGARDYNIILDSYESNKK